jgi:hypothetical protein
MPAKRKEPRRTKTSIPLEQAVEEVGLPADLDTLRRAFYKFHGGSNHTADTAWNRALGDSGLVLVDGKLEYWP